MTTIRDESRLLPAYRPAAFFGPTVTNGALRTWLDLLLVRSLSRMTHLRSGGCIAAVETVSISAAGEEPSGCIAAVETVSISAAGEEPSGCIADLR